jgi:hypothetical protein
MPGVAGQIGAPLIYAGCFDDPTKTVLNSQNDWIVVSTGTGAPGAGTAVGYASFNSAAAVTLLAAGHPAGLYSVTIYAVLTTAFVTNTTWNFSLGFTDDYQAQSPVAFTSSTLTIGTILQGTYQLRSTGATALTYTPGKTGSAATAGAVQFSIIVQRLQ